MGEVKGVISVIKQQFKLLAFFLTPISFQSKRNILYDVYENQFFN